MTGVTGQSSLVGTLEMATMTSKDCLSAHLPKTGCFDEPGENQSRKSLCTTFMKNWEPPELGWPVFAIESVPAHARAVTCLYACANVRQHTRPRAGRASV
eukprot:6202253-Pleurochrysis_carterae.AAC.1